MDSGDPNALKYTTMFRFIHQLNMRNVRDVYRGMRISNEPSVEMLFPRLGITMGEFVVAHVVKTPRRTNG